MIDIFKNKLIFYKERTIGIGNIRRYLNFLIAERNDCEFNIESNRETKGRYADKTYWILTYKEYDDNIYNDIGIIIA